MHALFQSMNADLVERIVNSSESTRALAAQFKAEGHVISREMIGRIRRTGAAPAGRQRLYSDELIARIHASLASNRAMAKRLAEEGIRIDTETIRQIRLGLIYADLMPAHRQPGSHSCDHCIHWRGIEAVEPCDLGHPDPIDEGMGFARDCSTYKKAPG